MCVSKQVLLSSPTMPARRLEERLESRYVRKYVMGINKIIWLEVSNEAGLGGSW